jgi:hypothetical protein
MKEYIERTEELVLAVNAGARAIENNKRYHGTTYCIDVFSNNPREIPYLKAAEVLRSVDEIPAADVVEVVRCKDCKHKRHLQGATDEENVCGLGWGLSGLISEEDFCSYGERRTTDEN